MTPENGRVENAHKTIEGNNGYASSEPEERNHIVWALGTGVNALKEGLITREQVDSIIIAPLKHLAKKFTDAIMGEAAKTALSKVLTWLASLF